MIEHPRKTDYLNAYSPGAGYHLSYLNTRSHRTNGASRPVTPYDRYVAYSSNIEASSTESSYGLSLDRTEIVGRAYMRAYDDLSDKVVGEQSSLGIAAVEMGETLSMVANRLEGVLRFAKAVKRRDFSYVKNILRDDYQRNQAKKMDSWAESLTKFKKPSSSFQESRERYLERYAQYKSRSRRRDLKSTGGLWLEYWLGWAPTIGDVQTTLNVLAHDFPYENVKDLKPGTYNRSYRDNNGTEFLGGTLHNWQARARCSVKIATKARVNNPNAYLSNRLGTNNLLDIAWQAVPLSFLVDWKLGLSNHLQRFTALDGVELSESSISTKLHWRASGTKTNSPEYELAGFPSYGPYSDETFSFERSTGPVYVPQYYPNELQSLSVVRGATAISLILQLLKG